MSMDFTKSRISLDVVRNLGDAQIYKVLDTPDLLPYNEAALKLELTNRDLPLKRRGRRPMNHVHAKRRCGVTGGFVDLSTITKLPKARVAGYPIDPWHRNVKV